MDPKAILINTVSTFFSVLSFLIIARAILSWVRPRGSSRWFYEVDRLLGLFTEPILHPIRRMLPAAPMGIDFSPLVALILISVVERILVTVLERLI